MTPTSKQQIIDTYSAAADHFEAPPLAYWNYFGERTVERAGLAPGAMVLDVCCGAGASAVPAARAIAPTGRVIGVDLAPPLLELARAKGMPNAEFRQADFEQVYFRAASFDAVVCVFGIFFLPDMTAALQKMWRFLRPGGVLAITVWGENAFAPLDDIFPGPHRWSRLAQSGALESLFAEAGVPGVETADEDYKQPVVTPEDWWTICLGSGYRGKITPENRDALRAACLAIESPTVPLPVRYAIARR
ncbi:MAG: Methyltransferase type 11 [Candidatus Solibacter sp.]|jgi:SAM-dependent methyltransferase|nr:Methyltransferase type 11 [Candidatus Solibacter sp.]